MGNYLGKTTLPLLWTKIKALIPGVATTTTDGLMSSTDKAKLDGLESGIKALNLTKFYLLSETSAAATIRAALEDACTQLGIVFASTFSDILLMKRIFSAIRDNGVHCYAMTTSAKLASSQQGYLQDVSLYRNDASNYLFRFGGISYHLTSKTFKCTRIYISSLSSVTAVETFTLEPQPAKINLTSILNLTADDSGTTAQNAVTALGFEDVASLAAALQADQSLGYVEYDASILDSKNYLFYAAGTNPNTKGCVFRFTQFSAPSTIKRITISSDGNYTVTVS